jgi:hypothetical protein
LPSLRDIRARYLIVAATLACAAALILLVAFAGGSDAPQGTAEAKAELPPDPWAANPGGHAPDPSEIKRQAIRERRAAKAAADIDP